MGFITIEGENQIAAKQGAGEPLNIVSFVLGNIDGLGDEPANRVAALPAPADIMDTLAVTKSGYVNTNQVVYSLVMDSSIGDYDFNWVGLVDDEGKLIAVTHTPLIQKRATDGGVPGNNLTRNFLIAFSGIQATAAIDAPAETWQIDFNARLHGIDERERLSNLDIYGAAGFLEDGWSVERDGATTTYNVLAGIGYVGGIRIASALTQQVTVANTPAGIWLDVSLQGDISDMSAVVDFVIDNVSHSNYTDPNGFNHYLTEIASIAGDGTVTDERFIDDEMGDHIAASDPHTQYLLKANTPSQAEAEAGTSTTVRAWSSLRVRQAINAVVKAATESVAGIARIATQAETDAGSLDDRIVTPKKLRFGFSILLSTNGYVVFPSWMGGFIVQWGAANSGIHNFPIQFPNEGFVILNADQGTINQSISAAIISSSEFRLYSSVGASDGQFWLAIGH